MYLKIVKIRFHWSPLWSILVCKIPQFWGKGNRFGQSIILFKKVDNLTLLKIHIMFCSLRGAKIIIKKVSAHGLNMFIYIWKLYIATVWIFPWNTLIDWLIDWSPPSQPPLPPTSKRPLKIKSPPRFRVNTGWLFSVKWTRIDCKDKGDRRIAHIYSLSYTSAGWKKVIFHNPHYFQCMV